MERVSENNTSETNLPEVESVQNCKSCLSWQNLSCSDQPERMSKSRQTDITGELILNVHQEGSSRKETKDLTVAGIPTDLTDLTDSRFIDILKSGDKNEIVKAFNDLLKGPKIKVYGLKLNHDVENSFNGETLLHIALKYDKTYEFAIHFMHEYPNVLKNDRGESSGFKGQTPLHVAIVKGSREIVKTILETAENNKMIDELLNKQATGKKFTNTVLMGQLPLSVAALACKEKDFKIMENLISKGAKIQMKNKDGDTVFHSLIKYADNCPDRMSDIKASFEFLWEKVSNSGTMDIRYLENKSKLTPLHLSAKLGVSQLFDFIINIEDIYCFKNTQDGLFDIREYDVTEFDRLIYYKEKTENAKLTILESLFHSKCTHQEAFEILDQRLVQYILRRKWMAYRIPLFLWMVVHLIFITQFTVSAINKTEALFCFQNNQSMCHIGEVFYATILINIIFGIVYSTFAGLCIKKLFERCINGDEINVGLILHNFDYVVCLLVVAIGAVIESFLILLKIHWDFHLVITLICGWYFMLYFSPFSKNLVSFTYMIKRGFLEDFVPFGLVFLWLLFSFTGIMHILFLGGDKVDEFDTFQNSLLTMFNLGVGLNNIDVLNAARVPWLAYTLFVVFAILSFIHLFNALIAVMSQTFSDVHTDKNSYLKYNKLRMIELFEDIVLVDEVIKYLPFLKKAIHWKKIGNTKDNHGKNSGKIRFRTVLHLLEDLNDDLDEREERKNESEPKHRYLRKVVKKLIQHHQQTTHPERDITYVQIQKI